MYSLKIITSTVRPGRKGPVVANWVKDVASKHGAFEVELLELGAINLPLMNEEHHPMLRKYQHEHTKQWSARIDSADAFIFVTAEYDYNYPAPLRNALEYLYHEWNYKAAAIVSYGGVSAGTRAWVALKADLSTFKMVALTEAVNIPFFTQYISEEEIFTPTEIMEKSANNMLNEIARWTKGLETIRHKKTV
jgi:NAD(P)H-dependent FMN reductase